MSIMSVESLRKEYRISHQAERQRYVALRDVLTAKLAAPEVAGTHSPVTPFRVALKLSQITYAYPGTTEPALKDISLGYPVWRTGLAYRRRWCGQEHTGGYPARSAHPHRRAGGGGWAGHPDKLARLAGSVAMCRSPFT